MQRPEVEGSRHAGTAPAPARPAPGRRQGPALEATGASGLPPGRGPRPGPPPRPPRPAPPRTRSPWPAPWPRAGEERPAPAIAARPLDAEPVEGHHRPGHQAGQEHVGLGQPAPDHRPGRGRLDQPGEQPDRRAEPPGRQGRHPQRQQGRGDGRGGPRGGLVTPPATRPARATSQMASGGFSSQGRPSTGGPRGPRRRSSPGPPAPRTPRDRSAVPIGPAPPLASRLASPTINANRTTPRRDSGMVGPSLGEPWRLDSPHPP